jgi:integrase
MDLYSKKYWSWSTFDKLSRGEAFPGGSSATQEGASMDTHAATPVAPCEYLDPIHHAATNRPATTPRACPSVTSVSSSSAARRRRLRRPGTRSGSPASAGRTVLAALAGLPETTCCHTFRATGITTYLQNGGTIEHAQQIANHESPATTKLYDRTNDAISLDEIERILI